MRQQIIDDAVKDYKFRRSFAGDQKLESGLKHIGRHELWNAIDQCCVGNKCQSLWCPTCRASAVDWHRRNVFHAVFKDGYSDEFASFEALQSAKPKDVAEITIQKNLNDRYSHISGHLGLSRPNCDGVQILLDRDRKRRKRIRERGAASNLWYEFVYEFELVHHKYLKFSDKCPKKRRQIAQLRSLAISEGRLADHDELMVYVHWHGICNLSSKTLNTALGKEYWFGDVKPYNTNDCGLYVQKLHSTKPLFTNLIKITSYPFKNRKSFKHSFVGNDLEGEKMTSKELATLATLYHDLQGRSWRSLRGSKWIS